MDSEDKSLLESTDDSTTHLEIGHGVKCLGERCERYYCTGEWSFKKGEDPALSTTSFVKSPVSSSKRNKAICSSCGDQQLKRGDWKVDSRSGKQSCCPKSNWSCLKYCCRPAISYYWPGLRKFNPIWTGDDNGQIGIFVRNLVVKEVNESTQTITAQFYLNIVWLDNDFCE